MDISPLCLSSPGSLSVALDHFLSKDKICKNMEYGYGGQVHEDTGIFLSLHSEQKRRHHVCLPDILHAGRKEKAITTPPTCDIFQRFVWIPVKDFWYVNNELMTLGHCVVVTSLILLALPW